MKAKSGTIHPSLWRTGVRPVASALDGRLEVSPDLEHKASAKANGRRWRNPNPSKMKAKNWRSR